VNPKYYAIYGYTLDDIKNRRAAIVMAETENQAMIRGSETLNDSKTMVGEQPFFFVTHAREVSIHDILYPGKVGGDF